MNDILKIIPTMQSVSLLNDNYKNLKKKKPSIVKQGMKNIVGSEMISLTSNFT